MMTILELLKLELGIEDTSKDAILQLYTDKAIKRIESFTKQTKAYIEANLQYSVIDLAVITYNRKATEGLKSQSYSGVSETYSEDIPTEVKRDLLAHRLLKKVVEV